MTGAGYQFNTAPDLFYTAKNITFRGHISAANAFSDILIKKMVDVLSLYTPHPAEFITLMERTLWRGYLVDPDKLASIPGTSWEGRREGAYSILESMALNHLLDRKLEMSCPDPECGGVVVCDSLADIPDYFLCPKCGSRIDVAHTDLKLLFGVRELEPDPGTVF